MRIIAAAVVLGLGIVGIALAQQQAGQQPKEQGGDRAKLRAEVARLRAEVEVRELEHDVDADVLREGLKELKQAEFMASMNGPIKEYMKTVVGRSNQAKTEAAKNEAKAPPSTVIGPGPEAPQEPVHVPVPDEVFSMPFDENYAVARLGRPLIDRLRNDFVKKAAELAEKRLELADLEKRYNETR
ncbi:MAG: hypothetical protein ACYC61_19980 [Isosphaeraceae bacterium]